MAFKKSIIIAFKNLKKKQYSTMVLLTILAQLKLNEKICPLSLLISFLPTKLTKQKQTLVKP